MTTQEIISGLFAFLLGLLAKFIYDLWVESRKQQSLTFTKKVLSSFSVNLLGESLADRTQLYFSGEKVQSIQVVSVEVENTGSRAVKNQAFTVRFDDKARILGLPKSTSDSEDLRFVREEKVTGQDNAYRFNLQLLQKGHRLAWEFAVVDNRFGRFVIEHGIAGTKDDLKDADLDVSSVTRSKAQLDLIGQVKRALALFIGILIVAVIKDSVVAILGNQVASALNAIILLLLVFLLYNLLNLVAPFLDTTRIKAGEGSGVSGGIDIGGTVDTIGGNVVGRDYIHYVTQIPFFLELSKDMLQQLDIVYERIEALPDVSQPSERAKIQQTINAIVSELQKGVYADLDKFESSLRQLGEASGEIFQMVANLLLMDTVNIPAALQTIVRRTNNDIGQSLPKALNAPRQPS